MVNKIILQGRLVADTELKHVGNDIAVTEFTIAWSEKYKDTERKLFLRCKAWRGTAEFINKYFIKGQEIVIEGTMQTEEWEQDGEKKSRTICNIEKANFCGSKSDAGAKKEDKQADEDGFVNVSDSIDEELPFN